MTQANVVAFLKSGAAFTAAAPVEVVETHGAYVFLCGDEALKLKREVRYDYMDLSTPERRHAMLLRELALNSATAPEIYRDVLPITSFAGTALSLDGLGEPVDWVLRMHRFPAEDELERIAERGALDERLATAIGSAIACLHRTAPVSKHDGAVLIRDILAELRRVFSEFEAAPGTERLAEWTVAANAAFLEQQDLLRQRGHTGHVRRGHGDLHLRNMVLIDQRPVPFDALEFDETLGTCDILYDLSFMIMDLIHRNLRPQACRTLDAWLRDFRGTEDAGLAALPLFLSLRAAIRAMVLLQSDKVQQHRAAPAQEVRAYLDLSCDALKAVPARLVAVGGYSGSGKTVVARALAPAIGVMPGAVMLSSDLERKACQSTEAHLDARTYTADQRAAIYAGMLDRATVALDAGHSAILDATFADVMMRAAAEDVARRANVPFSGIWLSATRDLLASRILNRRGDASDADVTVLDRQIARGAGEISWTVIDASGSEAEVVDQGRKALTRA